MCIQYIKTIKYKCNHCEDADSEFIECEEAETGQCAGIEEQPAPSERNREEECPECEAAASAAAAASTEPESEPTPGSQAEGEDVPGR